MTRDSTIPYLYSRRKEGWLLRFEGSRIANMKIVIPMAGKGTRFKEGGIQTPKMLVPVLGLPMLFWALKNLPKNYDDYIFIGLARQIRDYKLDRVLKTVVSEDIHIASIEEPTEGQACTVLGIRSFIDNEEPLLIHNIDTYFECDLGWLSDKTIDGAVPYFESDDPNMSFLRMGEDHAVLEVAEKKPISTHATVGLYFFRRGCDFVWGAERMIRNNRKVRNEFYIGPVYNELISRGDHILGIRAKTAWDLGTPEKVKLFERNFADAN